MSRYIDADVLKEKILEERDKIPFKKIERYSFGFETPHRDGAAMRGGIRKALRCLEQTPTVDVVEVVRCKDCKWCEDLLMSGLYCNHPDNRNPIHCLPDDFCNCGERSENGKS